MIGDGTGAVSHVWERECSLQRQRQKIVEIAPAPHLPAGMRDRLLEAAVALAKAVKLRSLATIEFLVDASPDTAGRGPGFAFIEANPRLQVEHTVTEEVTGLDLVAAQLEIAKGRTLTSLGLEQIWIPMPRGIALQARLNMETMTADGGARPGGGTLQTFEPPTGPGLRVDAFGYAGYATSPRYNSLLAKLIVHARSGLLTGCLRQGRASAGGVSDCRRADQCWISAKRSGACRCPRRQRRYALDRLACRGLAREYAGAGDVAPFRGGARRKP